MILDISLLIAITLGLTEVLKRAFNIPKNLLPLVAVVTAFVIGGISALAGLTEMLFYEGIIAGLAAGGLWDLGKIPVVGILSKIKKTPPPTPSQP